MNNDPRQAADTLREHAADLAGKAKEQAAGAVNQKMDVAHGELENLASALRRAGNELSSQNSASMAGRAVTRLADRVESIGRSLEGRDLDDIITNVETFARRSPAAFLGGAALIGFAAARFLKSTSGGASHYSGRSSFDEDEHFYGVDYGTDRPMQTPGVRTSGTDHGLDVTGSGIGGSSFGSGTRGGSYGSTGSVGDFGSPHVANSGTAGSATGSGVTGSPGTTNSGTSGNRGGSGSTGGSGL